MQPLKAKMPATFVLTKVRASRIDALGRAIDPELTLTPLDLQASKIGRRFSLSASFATAIAVIAFANGRA